MTQDHGISISDLHKHIKILSQQFPRRHTGEPQEKEAVDYIVSKFEKYGLDVWINEIPVMGWEVLQAPELILLEPENRQIECVPFIFSGSTPHGGLTGILKYVGTTLASGFLEWYKFAIVDPDTGKWKGWVVGRPDGPAITQSGPPAGFYGTQDGPHYTWPACIIGKSDYEAIREWLKLGKEVKVKYSVQVKYKPECKTFVVEGKIQGSKYPDEEILVCAHHDSQGAIGFPEVFNSPGACDNASSVAAILEIARKLKASGTDRTLIFCTFGGEERNFTGSREFVRLLIETRRIEKIVGVLNLDQMANGKTLTLFCSEEEIKRPVINIKEIAEDIANDLKLSDRFPVKIVSPPLPSSDHWPFYIAGLPTMACIWRPVHNHAYHRNKDTIEYCSQDEKYMASLSVAWEYIRRLDKLEGIKIRA
ncbi:MAG: aminopeptidase YwaD [Thermosediminibacterales bacterium]|nr:aminopeptidase YwaD [Thermosediminibacterales bacterium]